MNDSVGWTSSDAIDLLAAALCEALPTLGDVAKSESATVPTKGGGSYSYTYANLAQVLAEIRPKLGAHGLAVLQSAYGSQREGSVTVETTILHKSGQWMRFTPLALNTADTPQTAGSAITYARRYSVMPALGLATEDDDGARASARQAELGDPRPITERDDLTPPVTFLDRDWVEAYEKRARKSGLDELDMQNCVSAATDGRTRKTAQVYQSEWEALNEATRALVTRRRQDMEATPPTGTDAEDAAWRADAQNALGAPETAGAPTGSGEASNEAQGAAEPVSGAAEGGPPINQRGPETGLREYGAGHAGNRPANLVTADNLDEKVAKAKAKASRAGQRATNSTTTGEAPAEGDAGPGK